MKGTTGYAFTADGQADLFVELFTGIEDPEELLINAFRASHRWGFRPSHVEKIIEAYRERIA